MTLRIALVIVYSLSVAGAADAQIVRAEEHQQRVSEARQLLAKDDAKSIDRYRLLLAALVETGRLTADDGRRFAIPNLQITVMDRRTDQSRSLPALPR